MTPKQLIDAAVAPLFPALRQAGFRQNGRRFHKDIGESRVFLEVQASQWNDQESARFTINLAVYVPAVLRKRGKEVGPPPKSNVGCTWYERIGSLTPAKLDLWWRLNSGDSIEEVSNQVLETVQRYALPWLEVAATYEGFCEFLTQSTGIGAADVLWSLGFHAEAIGCVKRLLQRPGDGGHIASEWLQAHEHAS